MGKRVVVAGAGFAGLNSALMLDRNGFDVVLIDQNSDHVFRPGLGELIRGRFSERSLKLDLESFLGKTTVEFKQDTVESIDPDKQVVKCSGEDHDYDYLVLGLGSERVEPDFDLKYTEDFYSLESSKEAVQASEEADSAVVIGSSYTGVEIATELHEKNVDVTLVDGSTRPMPESDEKTSQVVLDHFNRTDLSFRGGQRVEIVTNYGVELENGSELEADMVVWCGGLQASKTVQESFETDPDGLDVNSGLSALEYDNVFAAGDCADDNALDTAQNAEKGGLVVAENICSGSELLKDFNPGFSPILVSLGPHAILEVGDRVYKSRLLRYMKDLVPRYYFLSLRYRRLRSRLG